jgi:two-component system, OmpR family, KDP operon response regulator KdpE
MRTESILVCDPDPRIQRALQVILRGGGYKVLITASGEEALDRVTRDRPQAVILELALPDIDGIKLCRRLRRCGEIAILVLSTINDESAMIEALESGADDYMTKPFSPGELIARLAARLRAAPSELRVQVDGLTIDVAAHLVTFDGEEVHLTPIEFALLRVLATSRGAVTHGELATRVWGPLHANPALRVRAHIANLRAKLDRGQQRNLIRTEVGIGYRLARPDQAVTPSVAPRRPVLTKSSRVRPHHS